MFKEEAITILGVTVILSGLLMFISSINILSSCLGCSHLSSVLSVSRMPGCLYIQTKRGAHNLPFSVVQLFTEQG